MVERKALPPLKHEQAQASRPRAHVWLSASAGTGKTHVLSARVLRLLLSGVSPERILCLTFTKAGAAEMAERVHGTLARWVQVDEAALFDDLEALGEASGPEACAKARLLFAKVLDATGGGLKIQTIHSFCQSLLASFPLEAGLVPGFKPLDDRARAELSRAALITMIEQAERSRDRPLIAAIEALALRLGEDSTVAYLAKCVDLPTQLDRIKEEIGQDAAWLIDEDIGTFLLAKLGLPTGDLETYIAEHCADAFVSEATLRALAEANRSWNTKTGHGVAECIASWLASEGAARVAMVDQLLSCLVTKEGLAKNRGNEKLLAAEPAYADLAEEIGRSLRALSDLPGQVDYVRQAAQGLKAGLAYARAYAAAKRLAGMVDFDDLIGRASELLKTEGISEWIRYKLDQRIDHMLVDEAQDTNERQWDLVEAIVEDYFETEPDDGQGTRRTLFVVGDTKQAIFGFQGTSPKAFVEALQRFQARAERTGHVIDELPLALSFRSMPAVLDVVDATLAEIGHGAVGLPRPPEHHHAARRHPGQVLLLPPTIARRDADEDETEGEEEIADEWTWLADHERAHAERIAQQVKAWLDDKLLLRSKGRAVRPGDILILLRSRGALSRLIVARLYEAGVPVAGVDRLRLQAPLAVQDLLAALRFAVQPEDDLNLANLLVSPLIGWTQDDLLARVPRAAGVSLWSHLRATLDEDMLRALRELLNAADFTTPYRYLEAILSGPMEGRRKLAARLGEEARDAIDELLNAALGFEADDHPSLQRFIDWFDRGDADIKRELAESGDMVRVMTVHGSKGLESSVVILADAAFDPARRPRGAVLDLPIGDAALPLVPPTRAESNAMIAEARDRSDAADMEEHWRLLYVGMTRAEEMLVVTGALGPAAKGEPADLSWHATVGRAMAAMGAGEFDAGGLRWSGPDALPDAPEPEAPAPTAEGEIAPPLWLHQPAPAEARPPRPLAPSAETEDDVPNPPPSAGMLAAAQRGRLLHALFERLPDVAPDDRHAAADRWLAGVGGIADAAQRADLISHILAVIDDPAHAALFSHDALVEAPIAAVVGGQVIAGTVDRLLVTERFVHVVDFKTGRAVPAEPTAVPRAHLRQMAAYSAALGAIFLEREIRASLLYSAGPRLIDLPEALLAPHKPGFVPAQENL
jgi:ATP-dependent helicase/nuclease subunit A